MKRGETAGDHVISMYFSWTCPGTKMKREKPIGDHVISMYISGTCPVDQNEMERYCRGPCN